MALSLWSPRRWRDGETQCSKVRSDKSRTDQVCGAKQRQGRAVYPALEQKATIHFLCPILVCAFGEQGRSTALTPLLYWGQAQPVFSPQGI